MYLMYYEDEAGNRVYTLKVGVQPCRARCAFLLILHYSNAFAVVD